MLELVKQIEYEKFDLNIEKILENWEPHHAIREIIANALDEQIITDTKEIEIFKQETNWIIRDYGRGFSHYKEAAGIKKDISLSNLRKTYLTWHHQVLGDDTGLVSSHSTTQVLEKYYLDPKVLTAVEISALKVRVFGKK